MALQQFVAGGFAERRVAGQDREDVAWVGHHPQAAFSQATFQGCCTLLVVLVFDLACL